MTFVNKRYQLYGLAIESTIPLPALPAQSSADPDVFVEIEQDGGEIEGYLLDQRWERILADLRTGNRQVTVCMRRDGDVFSLYYDPIGVYRIAVDGWWVTVSPLEATPLAVVEQFLLGPILSFLLERQGFPNLHASAVVIKNVAVAYVGESQAGKSVLAASLVAAGYPLLTDDILPLTEDNGRIQGIPGYPQMKLWAQMAAEFVEESRDLPLVIPGLDKRRVLVGQGWGAFHSEPCPLRVIYLVTGVENREDTEIAISPLSPAEATIELIRHTFSAGLLNREMQTRQFDFYARMALKVPMRRLSFPRRLELLPAVREAILEDLERLPQ